MAPPWRGDGHAERTAACLPACLPAGADRSVPPCSGGVGGDWNHALEGPEWAGSVSGRQLVLDAVAQFGLTVPTAAAGRSAQRESIDHIAVGRDVGVRSVVRVDHGGLSDHDAYVVEVA